MYNMEFLDLCDDALDHILGLSRPFEAVCLGVSCRRLYSLAREQRAAIAAKFRATGRRGLCHCLDPVHATAEDAWFWGHPECTKRIAAFPQGRVFGDAWPRGHPARRSPTKAVANMCALAAGGHADLFWKAAARRNWSVAWMGGRENASHYAVFNAAVGAGEGSLATALVTGLRDTCRSWDNPDLSATEGIVAAVANGHLEVLREGLQRGGWDGVPHDSLAVSEALVRSDARVELIWDCICAMRPPPSFGGFVEKCVFANGVRAILECRRMDILKLLNADVRWKPTYVGPLAFINLGLAGREMIGAAAKSGIRFESAVLKEVMRRCWAAEAVAMAATGGGWPEDSIGLVVEKGSVGDIEILAAAGCPSGPWSVGRAFERGDPARLLAVLAAPGASWPIGLLGKLRREGGAAAALARSIGAPL